MLVPMGPDASGQYRDTAEVHWTLVPVGPDASGQV